MYYVDPILYPLASQLLNPTWVDEMLSTTTKYPPYDVVKHNDEKMSIEFAVAGVSKEDIDITVENGYLYIRGEPKKDDRDYIHKGIAKRSFSIKFKLADYVQISSASIDSGLLVIELSTVVPEEKKPKKIEIKETKLLQS